jgi:hypothetical protein
MGIEESSSHFGGVRAFVVVKGTRWTALGRASRIRCALTTTAEWQTPGRCLALQLHPASLSQVQKPGGDAVTHGHIAWSDPCRHDHPQPLRPDGQVQRRRQFQRLAIETCQDRLVGFDQERGCLPLMDGRDNVESYRRDVAALQQLGDDPNGWRRVAALDCLVSGSRIRPYMCMDVSTNRSQGECDRCSRQPSRTRHRRRRLVAGFSLVSREDG